LNARRKQILSVVGVLALLFIVRMVWRHFNYVSTDDAQVGAHVALLSSRVNGTIQKVFVEENQHVKQGEPLAQIDTSDYSSASQAAEAQVASLQARYKEAEVNFKRATELFAKQAIARERFDAAQADFKDTGAKLRAAQAQLEQAQHNVNYTRILAPADGTVARKSVEPGQFVQAGQPLFGFVSSNERWVTANLKETELPGVVPGRKVDVDVDAIPDKSFQGEVESVSPSTGAVFSLLPPDNATGNFTKVVQRVPVRIKLVGLSPEDIERLHAGLSADVSIHVR
jgi:membrane fusion protein (multidrug efflux system)